MSTQVAEADMLEPLLEWLERRGQVRTTTIVVPELSWSGRRVDLAVCNASGIMTSFELKLRDNGRALSQAMLNALAFDRSYIVTMTTPSPSTIDAAASAGIGIVLVDANLEQSRVMLRPAQRRASERVRTRLRTTILARQHKNGGTPCSAPLSVTT